MSDLTDDVKRLVVALGTVEAVEVLLLLARAPERSFASQEIVQRLHVHGSLESTLDRLASLNLVDVRLAATLRYRFSPTSEGLGASVRQLLRDYDERRLIVLEVLVAVRPSSALAAFADAFRFKRGKKADG